MEMMGDTEDSEASGRVLVDATGTVILADRGALILLGLPATGGKATLIALQHGLRASGLLPSSDSPDLVHGQADVPGDIPTTVESVCCRTADGGFTLALRKMAQTRAWLGSSDDQVRFLANFSHELRTPLTTLKTSLALIHKKAGDLPERTGALVEASRRNVDRLIGIISDVVDITSISSGQLALQQGGHDPLDLMNDAVRIVTQGSQRADIHVLESPQALPMVQADGERIVQVIAELLENASKCSQPGSGIQLSARVAGVEVEILVRDHGKGIPAEQLEHIFQPFRQADMSMSRDVGGLGLGLSICKGIVQEHGGRLKLENAPDGGALASFTLPSCDSQSQPGAPLAE